MSGIRNRYFLLIDTLLFLCVPALALLLRQDLWAWSEQETRGLVFYTALSIFVKLPVFFRYDLYNRYWRYAGIDELLSIASAVGIVTTRLTIIVVIERIFDLFPAISCPFSLPFIDGLLTLVVLLTSRFSELAVATIERRTDRHERHGRTRVLVVGAGDAGSMIAHELQHSDKLSLEPVGFVDDDPDKTGIAIHGIRVLGTKEAIPRLVKQHRIHEVIIAMPTAPGKTIREIAALCERARVPSKTVPGMYDIITGKVDVNHLRNVEIEDLLRREPVKTDMAAVTEFIRGKRILVTGGGGSIGSELCRQILRAGPTELCLLGHGENSIFEILAELNIAIRKRNTGILPDGSTTVLHPVIADIRDERRITAIFKHCRPETVFHAAAHKHVPLMECNVAEAVTNNILGTHNLLKAARGIGVEHVVMISTDKAVNPTSVMGATKRVAELLTRQAALDTGKSYVAVRFGNVLGSRGSVVLTFKRQISAGGPITITHPDMQRYFMVIPEAVQLVLQSAVMGRGGEIFMLDMGEPVKIVNLARDMIRLSGLEVGRDIEINFSGIRPGEKLFEELFSKGETYGSTTHEKIMIATHASAFRPQHLEEDVSALEAAAQLNDDASALALLHKLVPEFKQEQNGGRENGKPVVAQAG
jgi:FlaA1/EpsC-like NDP-sugar epimerase